MERTAMKELLELLSLWLALEAAAVVALAWLTTRLLRLLFERLAKRFIRYRLQISRLFPIFRLMVWLAAIGVIVFVILNPSEAIVLAISASIGLAFGLGAQDVLRNVFAGIVRLFDRAYSVGDMVRVGEHYGEVISFDINSTRLRTFDDAVVTIPNAEVLKQTVSNSNFGELTEMVVVEFDLPATVDVQQVKALAREAAESSPFTYLKKPISVMVEDRFQRTFLTRLKVKAYVVDLRLERLLASDIIERIKKELVARGLLTENVVLGMLSPAS